MTRSAKKLDLTELLQKCMISCQSLLNGSSSVKLLCMARMLSLP